MRVPGKYSLTSLTHPGVERATLTMFAEAIKSAAHGEIDKRIREKIPLVTYLTPVQILHGEIEEAYSLPLTKLIFDYREKEIPFNSWGSKECKMNLTKLQEVENFCVKRVGSEEILRILKKLIEKGEKFKNLKEEKEIEK
jgi:hypothetical protein